MKLYLAGPMRGFPEYNFPAFHHAAAELRAIGHTVWSPAERDESEGFDPKTDKCQSLKYYMKYDLPAVLEQDAIALLEGWERSTGANLEVHVARVVEMPVYTVAYLLESLVGLTA